MLKNKYVFLLIITGLLVYFNALFNDFTGDDKTQIVENNYTHSLANIPQLFTGSTFNNNSKKELWGLYYKPMLTSSYTVIYSLFGPTPFFFHLIQVVLHISNTILIFVLFSLFFSRFLSFCLSLIFLVHPMNVEAVSYIAALQDTLFFFFGMLAIILIKFGKHKFKSLFLYFIALLVSLLSKESGILYIFITSIYSFLFKKDRAVYYFLIAFLVLSIYAFLRINIAGITLRTDPGVPMLTATLPERLINIPTIIVYYLKTFIFPKNLMIDQQWFIQSVSFSHFFLPLILTTAFFLTIAGLGIWIYQKHRLKFTAYLFFSVWFLIGLGLHLQLVPLDMTVAERWFYFPMVGLLGLIGLSAQEIKIKRDKCKTVLTFAFILIILCFSFRTVLRNTNWKDTLTLLSHDTKLNADTPTLEYILAIELSKTGRTDEAIIHYNKALQLYPNDAGSLVNLAVIYEQRKDRDNAEYYLKRALASSSNQPLPYENMAIFMLIYQNPAEAKTFTQDALKKFPQNVKLLRVLAQTEYNLGDKAAVQEPAKQVCLLEPINYAEFCTKFKSNLPITYP